MPAEVEAKFRADGPGPLRALAGAQRLGTAMLGAATTVEEVDRYLDTTDGRLAAAGWACRLRRRPGSVRVSLKGPPEDGSGGWLHRRPELEGPAVRSIDPAEWPESPARAFVDGLRNGAPLVERFRLLQRRTERPVSIAGTQIGLLSLDAVAVQDSDRAAGELFAVELELASDATPAAGAVLAELAAALAQQPGLRPDPRSKLEHAVELLAAR